MPNRFNLRILAISDTDTIASELNWLVALRHEAGQRWIDGRHFTSLHSCHASALGRLVAQLHRFSAGWQLPEGFTRFHWDWDGQFGERELGNTAQLIAKRFVPIHLRTTCYP